MVARNLTYLNFLDKLLPLQLPHAMVRGWFLWLKHQLSLIYACTTVLKEYTLYIHSVVTLLEKQSKFPRYNMKCRRKPDTTWNIPRSITFSPQHFMLYRGKSITVGTVHEYQSALLSLYTCSCAAMLLVTGDPIHSFFIRYCLLFSVYCMFTYK